MANATSEQIAMNTSDMQMSGTNKTEQHVSGNLLQPALKSNELQLLLSRLDLFEKKVDRLFAKTDHMEDLMMCEFRELDKSLKKNIETSREYVSGHGVKDSSEKKRKQMENKQKLASDDDRYTISIGSSDDEEKSEDRPFNKLFDKSTPSPMSSTQSTQKMKSFVKTEHELYYGLSEDNSLATLTSNFRRGVRTEDIEMKTTECKATNNCKKLSFTPTSSELKFKFVSMVALKLNMNQRAMKSQTFWTLPPSFAMDIRDGIDVETLLKDYANEWMPPYAGLKYIYVPIAEVTSQWFLMVASIEDRMVYLLDSFLDEQSVFPRTKTIEKVCTALSKIVKSEYFPPKYYKDIVDIDTWEIKQADGNPHCPYGEDSIVWVIDWMHMKESFQLNILPKRSVRMKVAMDLICGDHNEQWDQVRVKVESFWRSICP
ncbi:Papain-like cysteine peptidase superfamily [Sesbania bispinosa]|nr:Papain-like cysteine peptidase superfamily [Sesbania bispinosa]